MPESLVFSCEFYVIFKNTFLTEQLWVTASFFLIFSNVFKFLTPDLIDMSRQIFIFINSIFYFRRLFDPSHQNLEWQSPPKNVLIIKKPSDSQVTEKFKIIAKWLIEVKLDIARSKISTNKDHIKNSIQKQLFREVLRKGCSENIQQIYRRTPMRKCDFNKVALQLY